MRLSGTFCHAAITTWGDKSSTLPYFPQTYLTTWGYKNVRALSAEAKQRATKIDKPTHQTCPSKVTGPPC